MRSFLAILFLGSALSAVACGGGEPPAEPAAQAPVAQPDEPPTGQDQPAAAPLVPARERLLGRWSMELTPQQQRQFELLELAFRDLPPSESELAARELNPDEQLMIGMILMGRQQQPDDQGLEQARQGIEELSSATLEISADRLVFSHGEDRESASYTVLSEEDSKISLDTLSGSGSELVRETVHINLTGDDSLTLRVEGDPPDASKSFQRR